MFALIVFLLALLLTNYLTRPVTRHRRDIADLPKIGRETNKRLAPDTLASESQALSSPADLLVGLRYVLAGDESA